MVIPNLAFILTHNRPHLLRRCIEQIIPQVTQVCVIDNASDPPVDWEHVSPPVHTLIHDPLQPPNLAELMNVGFEWAERYARHWSHERWNTVVLCDDVIIPDDWVNCVTGVLRALSCDAGSTHQQVPVVEPLVKTLLDTDIYNRMQGSACVFRGETGLRADERMHWWWQDTDLDFQARTRGGTVICPGPVVVNERPNDFTYSVPGLAERAGLDGEVFREKWGFKPW